MIKNFISNFVTGLLSIIPVVIGIYVVFYIADVMVKLTGIFLTVKHQELISITIVLSIVLITTIGMKINQKKQSAILRFFESIVTKFPVIDKIIYTIKDFVDMVKGSGKFETLGVARIPFANGKTNGLITDVKEKEDGTKEYTVFIVTGTFPPAGFVCYYDEKDVEIRKDMTPKDVFQLQVSLGISSEKKIKG